MPSRCTSAMQAELLLGAAPCSSMRCSCHRSICSTPSRRRLISTHWRRYSGRPDRQPDVRAGAGQAALGGDDARRVRVQRLADQVLADVRAVAVGGVDEVDAELDRAAQDGAGVVEVGGRAPDAVAGDAHGAEAEPVDGEVAADGGRCVRWCTVCGGGWHGCSSGSAVADTSRPLLTRVTNNPFGAHRWGLGADARAGAARGRVAGRAAVRPRSRPGRSGWPWLVVLALAARRRGRPGRPGRPRRSSTPRSAR